MNAKQIDRFLKAVGRVAAHRNGDWIHTACPFAAWRHGGGDDTNPSFGLRVAPGDSRVHCFSCNYSGTAGDVVVELTRLGAKFDTSAALDVLVEAVEGAPLELHGKGYEQDLFEPPPPAHIYPEELLDSFEPAYFSHEHTLLTGGGHTEHHVHPYLEGRHVPYEVAKLLDLRWDSYRNRILFPIRDFGTRLRGLHGRHDPAYPYAPDDPNVKYKMYPFDGQTNGHVWLGEHWVYPEEPVVIAESVFDLARVLEVYPNVMSPLTASLNRKKTDRLRGLESAVLMFDADLAGENARKRLRRYLPETRFQDVYLPEGKDAGDLPPAQIADLLEGLVELNEEWR